MRYLTELVEGLKASTGSAALIAALGVAMEARTEQYKEDLGEPQDGS